MSATDMLVAVPSDIKAWLMIPFQRYALWEEVNIDRPEAGQFLKMSGLPKDLVAHCFEEFRYAACSAVMCKGYIRYLLGLAEGRSAKTLVLTLGFTKAWQRRPSFTP